MSLNLSTLFSSGLAIKKDTLLVDIIPDRCPNCHKGMSPRELDGWLDSPYFQKVFVCPLQDCQSLFIAYYEKSGSGSGGFDFKSVAPRRFHKKVFTEIINKISTEFSNLYNEAFEAEAKGLLNICGAGYRKALEYLIKDYLIRVKNKPETEIKKKPLGSCIKEYFEDGNLKICAERAIWLGNDETHYYREWIDKDLKDLKDLMSVTLFWIESEYKTKRYELDMPPKK